MNKYELAVLYHPDLEVDLEKGEQRVKKIVADNKGKIVSSDSWGKRKLAYPIAKNESAVYVFYTAELPRESIGKVESTLNITDEVIRYLIVKIDPKAEAKIAEAKAEKEKSKKDDEGDKEE